MPTSRRANALAHDAAQREFDREQGRLLQERDQTHKELLQKRGLDHEKLTQERAQSHEQLIQKRNNAVRRLMQEEGLMEHDAAMALADREMRLEMQLAELEHQQKISQVDDYTAAHAIYTDTVNNINANRDMPSGERKRQLDYAETVRDTTIGAVDEIYGTTTTWTPPAPRRAPQPKPTTPTTTAGS